MPPVGSQTSHAFEVPLPTPPQTSTPAPGTPRWQASNEHPQQGNIADNADFADDEDVTLEFPTDLFPPRLHQLVAEVSRYENVPAILPSVCVLGCISASLGAGLQLQTGHHRFTRGNLFLMGLAPSGAGKGLTFDQIMKPLFECERLQCEAWEKSKLPEYEAKERVLSSRIARLEKEACAGINSAGANPIQKELAALLAERANVTRHLIEPKWIVSDITREKLAVDLSRAPNESLASISSEARGALGVIFGRYSKKTDEDIYLAGYSGDPCRVDRINRPGVRLHRPCLSILWLLQPDKFVELIQKESLAESGFLPRFLFVKANARPRIEPEDPVPMNAEVLNQWRSLVHQLAGSFHDLAEPVTLKPSTNACRHIREFANTVANRRNQGGDLQDIDEFAARWAEQAWRLAVVLHAGAFGYEAQSHQVDEAAARAVGLMHWFIQQQMTLLAPMREQRTTKRLESLISLLVTKPNTACTVRDLINRHGFSKEELERQVAARPDKLQFETQKAKAAGRPSRLIKLRIQT